VAEEDQSVPERQESETDTREALPGATIGHTSRLARRLEALEHRRHRPEPIVALKGTSPLCPGRMGRPNLAGEQPPRTGP
jgi:hypothetical protein